LIADEVFLCGTAARILPVKKIENYELQKPNIASLSSMRYILKTGKPDEIEFWRTLLV
jgi:branched-subunit amino acid aminotransferase/4-amino-4-deoxychorismate lyase